MWAFVTFSVSRTSAIVGTLDALWNIPIMPSDILMPGDILGFPGRVAILLPAGGLGLYPFLQRPPGVATDNLDALQVYAGGTCPEEFLDLIEWETFPPCGPTTLWMDEEDVEAWDSHDLGETASLPEGPLVPSGLVNPNPASFVRADSNADGAVDLSDAVYTLGYSFLGGPAPACMEAADANDTGEVDISDAIWTLGFLFMGGPRPPDPYPECGEDPSPDELGCVAYPPCP